MKKIIFLWCAAAALFAVGCRSSVGYVIRDGVLVFDEPQRAPGQASVLGLTVDPIPVVRVGFIGLGINSGAYVAEIIRGGLMSVDIGQTEAGRSLGLNYLDTMRFIVIPQAFKAILPSLGNEFITLFKDTSLVQAIGGMEMLYYAFTLGGRTYDFMPPLIGIALLYLAVVIIFTWLQGKLERRLRQSDRR